MEDSHFQWGVKRQNVFLAEGREYDNTNINILLVGKTKSSVGFEVA